MSSGQQKIRQLKEEFGQGNALSHPATEHRNLLITVQDIQSKERQSNLKHPLTEREKEILQQIAKGKTNQQIADDLVVSERTVRTHVTNILSKLGLSNRTQAVLYALKEGIAFIQYTLEDEEEVSN